LAGGVHVSSAPRACIRSNPDCYAAVEVVCASCGVTDSAVGSWKRKAWWWKNLLRLRVVNQRGPEQERMEENQTEKAMGNETCSEGTKVVMTLRSPTSSDESSDDGGERSTTEVGLTCPHDLTERAELSG
jgi:hypothetical protein